LPVAEILKITPQPMLDSTLVQLLPTLPPASAVP